MTIEMTRMFADDAGQTHLASIDLLAGFHPDTAAPDVVFRDIPLTNMLVGKRLRGSSPSGFHTAPRRQFVVCLRGDFEIRTSAGDVKLFRPGDWLLAEDVVGEGHAFTDLGEERVVMAQIGIGGDWEWRDQ